MFSRRSLLIRTSQLATMGAIAPVSSSIAWAMPENDPYLANIGIQLYTVRNQMAEAPEKTLQAISEAGYKQVELMDVMDAAKIVPIAKDKGLASSSAFLKWNMLGEAKPGADAGTIEQAIEVAKKHDLKYLVFGYIGKGHREKADQLKATADRCNIAGEACQKAGIQLCYHHHSFEFQPLQGGKTGMEIFIEGFDKDLCKFEIDVFWCAIGGWNPIETIKKLEGRVSQVHLKDLLAKTPTIFDEGQVPKEAFKEVGEGEIDMKAVIAMARKTGVAQCHVEQDQSPNPLQSIKLSLANLRKI